MRNRQAYHRADQTGCTVTGIDLSAAPVTQGEGKSGTGAAADPFVRCDARNLPFEQEFDAAIMLCEGAFPLMETDEMNFQILASVTRALKERAKFIFTTLNGLRPLVHYHTLYGQNGGQERQCKRCSL